MDISSEVVSVLDEVLSLKGRASRFALDTPLLGAIPELDSMAVVALITAIEERFGFAVDDDEIDGSVFTTLGSLIDFVQGKLDA
ncbi:MAG: phosphopantetheine-binding protein [Candidatus Accumulibacter propinquus]|jgi:acyl carrier protein|uniref:acyl carrier protein n=1 Tax=Candidatus Accumulibacter TaxID=327159 RepID=UPI001ACD7B50|nr:phosphopantetheine-binding protein [Accumulibacter sp.]MBN8437106.1 acyl carrier protein [Accumulibacter sp.]